MQALAVERGHRGVIHLVGRDLEHLVLEIDGVAGRARLEAGLAVLVETVATAIGGRDMAGRGAHHCQRPHRSGGSAGLVEFRFDQVARLEVRGIGIGDVLGKDALTFLMPLHLGA